MYQLSNNNLSLTALVVHLTKEAEHLDLPERLVRVRRTIGGRIVFTTSFGVEDQTITHAIFTAGLDIDVVSKEPAR